MDVKLSDVIMGMSFALDLVNQSVVDHHRQVTSFAARIAEELGLPDDERSDLAIASALHDIGAVSSNDKFEMGFHARGMHRHAQLGYLVLRGFAPFAKAANIVQFHHMAWDGGKGGEFRGEKVPTASHIVHLADRIAVLIEREGHVLGQVDPIRSKVLEEKDRLFAPDIVDAFLELSEKEYFWLDSVYTPMESLGIRNGAASWNIGLDLDLLLSLSDMFRTIIDYRSRLTATHSKSVASVSESIARMAGFSGEECRMMHIAGNFHDLGKLAVPVEILEKPDLLSAAERDIIRSHTYHTHRILDMMGGMEVINAWASLHHECLDGSGYPFHHKADKLPLGSRILAVADVFSALTEDRTYRKGLMRTDALALMKEMSDSSKLDQGIVNTVEEHFDFLCDVRRDAYEAAQIEFEDVRLETEKLFRIEANA